MTQVQAGSNGGAAALAADDDVDFTVVLDRRTGGTRAEGVRLIRRAADRRELGQVRTNLLSSYVLPIAYMVSPVC